VKKKKAPATTGRLVGYARVSTREQNLDMQIEALRRAGVRPEDLHVEKISASARKRPAFQWALERLRAGDTVLVWKLDRLGRDVREIHKTLDIIKGVGAEIKSLTEGIIDERSSLGKFALNMLAALAQLERDKTIERTISGVMSARERGIVFGQPSKLSKEQIAECKRWKKEGKSVREITSLIKKHYRIDVSQQTVWKHTKKPKPKT
jgi:DNA invertase Pin-like site-specific DNA recombinase